MAKVRTTTHIDIEEFGEIQISNTRDEDGGGVTVKLYPLGSAEVTFCLSLEEVHLLIKTLENTIDEYDIDE